MSNGTTSDPVLEVTYTVPAPTVTSTYTYDASGQRVKVVSGGVTTIYPTKSYNVDSMGKKIKHIMAGNGMVATIETSGVTTTPHYISTDHLTGSNVVSSVTGTLEELMDYYPFGSIRLDEKSGAFNEQRKFIGQEYDVDTGLNYLNARYYNSNIGRFISQDPLAIESLQTTDAKKFVAIISNPQNWNTYSYALNNPLRMVDPSGLLTVYVSGTGTDREDITGSHLENSLSQTFGEQPRLFYWNGGPNSSEDRSIAAQNLATSINDWDFASDEKLNIVAYSHGGSVALEATKYLNRPIDQLVTLGTPVTTYQAKEGMIRYHLQVSSLNDFVQRNAGTTGSIMERVRALPFLGDKTKFVLGAMLVNLLGGDETGYAGRVFPGANNKWVESKISDFTRHPVNSHYQLWHSENVWNSIVAPNLIK